jgi:hypothetical protein
MLFLTKISFVCTKQKSKRSGVRIPTSPNFWRLWSTLDLSNEHDNASTILEYGVYRFSS